MVWVGVAGFTLVVSAVSPNFNFGNTAHIRQSRPDYGLGFQVKFLKTFQVFPSSLGNGLQRGWDKKSDLLPL